MERALMSFLTTDDVNSADEDRDAQLEKQQIMMQILRAQKAKQAQGQSGGGGVPSIDPSMFMGSGSPEAGSVSGGGFSKIGEMFGGPGKDFMQFGGSDSAAGGADGLSGLASNPYAWLAAAIVGTAWGLGHNDVSSYQRQLKGKVGGDILNSPNWKNHVPDDASRALKPWLDDAHDPSHWKNIPKDLWDSSVKMPLEHTKKIGSWFKGLF